MTKTKTKTKPKPKPKKTASKKPKAADPNEQARRDFALIVERGAAASAQTFGRYSPDDRYFDPTDAPAGAPWSFKSNDAASIIDQVFKPLAGKADGFVSALKEACRRVVLKRDEAGLYHLLYFLERDRREALNVRSPKANVRYVTLSGAAPNAKTPKHLPAPLREFLAIHDGFGAARYGVDAILPAAKIAPLPALSDALQLYCDEVGNRVVLRKNGTVVDWDRETHETSGARASFFSWLSTGYATHLLDLDPWDFREGPGPRPPAPGEKRPPSVDGQPQSLAGMVSGTVRAILKLGKLAGLTELLLDGTVEPTAHFWTGETVFATAAGCFKLDLVKLLLEHGCPVDHGAALGKHTALFEACCGKGDAQLVAFLLERGANPNAMTAQDGTPLHAALTSGNAELVRVLLHAGADPDLANAKGVTARALAKEKRIALTVAKEP